MIGPTLARIWRSRRLLNSRAAISSVYDPRALRNWERRRGPRAPVLTRSQPLSDLGIDKPADIFLRETEPPPIVFADDELDERIAPVSCEPRRPDREKGA